MLAKIYFVKYLIFKFAFLSIVHFCAGKMNHAFRAQHCTCFFKYSEFISTAWMLLPEGCRDRFAQDSVTTAVGSFLLMVVQTSCFRRELSRWPSPVCPRAAYKVPPSCQGRRRSRIERAPSTCCCHNISVCELTQPCRSQKNSLLSSSFKTC